MTQVILNRRQFLSLFAAAAVAKVSIPAFDCSRAPYVSAGDSVSFCGLAYGPGSAGFVGGTIVHDVGPWDGVGYPCELYSQGFTNPPQMMPFKIYDADLYSPVKRGEVRSKMYDEWGAAYSADPHRYKNMASWVREQRFGEAPESYDDRRVWMARISDQKQPLSLTA